MVTIRADGTDPTGTVITTLTAPATITANAVNTFTAPVNTVLAANTTYWLRVNRAGADVLLGTTASDNESGATGWSISNMARGGTPGNLLSVDDLIQFAITGTLNPPNAPRA